MRIWVSLLATLVVLGMSRTVQAQAQYGFGTIPGTQPYPTAVGMGPTQTFAGVGNVNNNQFIYPNVQSAIEKNQRMNLASTGLFERITHMSFFNTSYNGYNSGNTQYPDMGMAYLQTFGYRVAQPAK